MVSSFAFGPVLIYLLTLGGWGLPLGIPPGPEDPVLANVAPENCLAYLSWAGTVKPDPTSKNQTEQLLAEPEVQALIAELRRVLHRAAGQLSGSDEFDTARFGQDMLNAAETILRCPGAVFLSAVHPEGASRTCAARSCSISATISNESAALLSKSKIAYGKIACAPRKSAEGSGNRFRSAKTCRPSSGARTRAT
jgi:hypothetical protein